MAGMVSAAVDAATKIGSSNRIRRTCATSPSDAYPR
jgi:hypothetical protein